MVLRDGQDIWINMDSVDLGYHLKQIQEPKRSTVAAYDFFNRILEGSRNVVDLGGGAGGPALFFAEKTPNTRYTVLDISQELLRLGLSASQTLNLKNIQFVNGDLYDFTPAEYFDCAISLQTLSWLPDFRAPLKNLMSWKPKYILLSSLFYEGEITAHVEITEHKRQRKTFYNCYSLGEVNRFASEYNYGLLNFKAFNLDVEIPKPLSNDLMSTYTVSVEGKEDVKTPMLLQISGPLLMNWYFLILQLIE